MSIAKRLAGAAGAVLLAVPVLAGCSAGGAVDSLRPASVGDDQWRLSALFGDALNLPEGAPVKLGGVVVGKVVAIEPADYQARVEMAIDDGVQVPADSSFRLRYTTGLGEVYVDVTPGRGKALRDGATVDTAVTSTAPTVEDSLASASLLVNGGSLAQVQTIVSELNTALGGRVSATKGMLGETDRFLGQVLASTREIDRLLGSLNDASATLNRRERTINRALREIRPAARSLDRSTEDLARLLRRTDAMAVTADRLVTRTRDDLTLVLEELGPVLEEVLGIEDRLVSSLDGLARFAELMDAASPTDYLNLKFLMSMDNPSFNDGSGDLGGNEDEDGGGDGDGVLPDLPPVIPDLPLLDLPGEMSSSDLLGGGDR